MINKRYMGKKRALIALLFLGLTVMLLSGAVSAADIYVATNGSDNNNGSSWNFAKKSIKNATGTANSGDTVNIANGIYNGTNNRGITIDKNLTITGTSQSGTIIDAEHQDRIFFISEGVTAFIKKITLTNGNTSDAGGAIRIEYGSLTVIGSTFTNNYGDGGAGAIYSYASILNVTGSTFTGNTGSAIYFNTDEDHPVGDSTVRDSGFIGNSANNGGAIHNNGGLMVINSTFTGNSANNYGGAIHNFGILGVTGSIFTGNTAESGGAIFSFGTLDVTGSTFTGNTATSGGAIGVDNDVLPGHFTVNGSTFNGNRAINSSETATGGAISIWNSTSQVINSTFESNYAIGSSTNEQGWGGAIYNNGGTLTVNGSKFYYNEASTGAGAIDNDHGTLIVNNSDFASNEATKSGGAISNWYGNSTVTNSDFFANSADYGGAIENDSGNLTVTGSTFNQNDDTIAYGGAIYNEEGTLNITTSTFTRNTAEERGGAIYSVKGKVILSNSNFYDNSADYGGGAIYSENSNLTVIGSKFLFNRPDSNGGAIYSVNGTSNVKGSTFTGNTASSGGAIYNVDSNLTVSGSTFTGNMAKNDLGGAIANSGNGSLTVTGSTFIGNTADYYGGAIYSDGANWSVTNSTFTGNSALDDGGAIDSRNGNLTVTGSTFISNTSGNGGAITSQYGDLKVSGSTFSNNTAAHGGAITSQYGDLTITSSVFTGNTANDYGGAVRSEVGDTTVNGSTFSNNTAFMGGAIYGEDNNLTVVGSTFQGNSAEMGGAITNLGTLTVTGSTFTGNKANIFGGAIYTFVAAGIGEIHFNRITGNSPANSEIFVQIGKVNATNNWWGSNKNPSGKVKALSENGAQIDVNPWLILKVTASPTTIGKNGKSNIKADLTYNSNNQKTTGGYVPNGTPVQFTTTKGSLTNKTNLVKGVATATLNSGSTSGKATVTGKLDSEAKTAGVNIDTKAPTVTATPKGGSYGKEVKVTLKKSETSTIYYTLNGAKPTTKSKKYTGAIKISKTSTLRYLAVDVVGNTYYGSQKYTISPKVTSTSPKNKKTGVARTATITIKFSENIKFSTNYKKIAVKNLSKGITTALKSVKIKGNTLTIVSRNTKIRSNWYQVTIPAKAVKDYAGNNIAKAYTFKFRIRA